MKAVLVGTVSATDQAHEWKLVRVDVQLEILKKFELLLADPTASFQLLTVKMDLRVMFLLLVLVGENFSTQFAFEFSRSFLFDAEMNALVMLSEVFGLRKVFVA